jgi:hypothetical protein
MATNVVSKLQFISTHKVRKIAKFAFSLLLQQQQIITSQYGMLSIVLYISGVCKNENMSNELGAEPSLLVP